MLERSGPAIWAVHFLLYPTCVSVASTPEYALASQCFRQRPEIGKSKCPAPLLRWLFKMHYTSSTPFRHLGWCLRARLPSSEPEHPLLGESKYGPGSGPQWKAGGSRYPNLYTALLQEPSRTRRTKLLEDNSRVKLGDGRIMRRPARARIRNQ